MHAQTEIQPTVGDAVSEGGGVLASLGIIVMVLFPFAIPGLVLVALVAVPLLVVGLVAALAAAVVAGPVLAIRALRRRIATRPGRLTPVPPVRGSLS